MERERREEMEPERQEHDRERQKDDIVTVTRIVRAQPHEVFAVWTQPAMVRQWAARATSIDPRAGTRLRQKVASGPGLHLVSGEYSEVVLAKRLVMTWTHENPPETPHSETRVIVDLNLAGPNLTELRVTEQPIPPADHGAAEAAWQTMLDALDPLIATLVDDGAWRAAG